MNGGDGKYSYTHNSSLQRKGVDLMKVLIKQGIVEKFDTHKLISFASMKETRINVADLGCSVGPNTFTAVQNIIDSIKLKLKSHTLISLEFQVFFNDQITNDFNTLFKNLPLDIDYFAAGIPGPFHGRLFPEKMLHFVHSSYALHWLSNSPRDLENKGKIFYPSAPKDVFEAYSTQFARDTKCFLDARAKELVNGGLMAILILCSPDGVPHKEINLLVVYDLLGDSLMDMAKEGVFDESKIDSFNLPMYNPTPKELKVLIEQNGNFTIENMQPLNHGKRDQVSIEMLVFHCRAALEGLIGQQFGDNIIDDLFDRFAKKIIDSSIYSESTTYEHMTRQFLLLKRNYDLN